MKNSALQGSSRFLSRSALVAALGSVVAVALAAGCASELDDPDSYTVAGGGGAGPTGGVAPTTGGTISNNGGSATTGGAGVAGATATGGTVSTGAPPLAACVKALFSSNCAVTCHNPEYADLIGGGLDLGGDNVGERLRNAMAQNVMATDKAACGTKLIDSDNPANSVLTKRVVGKGVCGPEMPTGAQLGAGDVKCIQDWVNLF